MFDFLEYSKSMDERAINGSSREVSNNSRKVGNSRYANRSRDANNSRDATKAGMIATAGTPEKSESPETSWTSTAVGAHLQ